MSDSVRPHTRQPTRLPHPWDSPGKNTGVGCHFLLQCMKVKSESEVAQSCPTPSDPMVCSLPGSSVHDGVLEWVAIAFSAHRRHLFLIHTRALMPLLDFQCSSQMTDYIVCVLRYFFFKPKKSTTIDFCLYSHFEKVDSFYIGILKNYDECLCVLCTQSLSHVQLFAAPWTAVPRLLCPWGFSSKNTGVGRHFLCQGIFLTHESNLGLLYLLQVGRQILYHCTT